MVRLPDAGLLWVLGKSQTLCLASPFKDTLNKSITEVMQIVSMMNLVLFRRFFLLPCSKSSYSWEFTRLLREKESNNSDVSFAEPVTAGYVPHILAA